jgi:hypothetical protein
MQIKTILPFLILNLTVGVLSSPAANEGPVEAREPQSCINVGCHCVDARQGEYCGYCPQVQGHWIWDDVYECNPSGGCCQYGYRKSCAEYKGPCGP